MRSLPAALLVAWAAPGAASAAEPTPLPPSTPKNEADRELLENLDLLLDWEMLQEWDPTDAPPLPVESEPPRSAPAEKPR